MANPNGETAIIAAAAGVITQLLPRLLALLTRSKLEERKLTLEALKADQDRLDESYNRLEAENKRLNDEVRNLRDRLTLEERAHQKTLGRCDQMETVLRRLNIQLPSGTDPRPT